MNIIFAKHATHQKRFAFIVPNELVPHIKKDMDVLVETKKGLQMARTVTGIFTGDGAMDVATQNGAYMPLKPVVSIVSKEMLAVIRASVQGELRKAIFDALNSPTAKPRVSDMDMFF